MDSKTGHMLGKMTSEFYIRNAESFSATRSNAWQGWNVCIDTLRKERALDKIKTVADIGCGNLRFEAFLAEKLDSMPKTYAIDNCLQLLPKNDSVHFIELDLVETLLTNQPLELPSCDLACAFGLMHHIPGRQTHLKLLDEMTDALHSGGYGVVSLWQFMKDERIANKAHETTRIALESFPQLELEENDYLLGWQNETDTFRYCHHFDEKEITEIAAYLEKNARISSRFEADGKSGKLNFYLMFQKR